METPWQRATSRCFVSIASAQAREIVRLLQNSPKEIPAYYRDFRVPINAVIQQNHLTILHLLAQHGHPEVLESVFTMLYDACPDQERRFLEVNVVDQLSWSPLHYAAHNGHIHAIEVILRFGGLLLVEDSKGRTPKDVAKDNDTVEFIESQERIMRSRIMSAEAKLWVVRHKGELFLKGLQPGVLRSVVKYF
mmetsp:Transcript_33908/g.59104  ORF Transcript_33908/g.59104 Transcript_33908/m.59104 type:complete len:192 (+) Transcript_33908:3148-3723(+)